MMHQRWLVLTVLCLGAGVAQAQHEVYVAGKEKPIKANIAKETINSVSLVTKEIIPADKMQDVVYNDLMPISVRTAIYRAGVKSEKDSLDPANESKRKGLLEDAIKKYQETLQKADAGDKSARRHMEYKIAMLAVRQVREDGAKPDDAIQKLSSFKVKHKDAWQLGNVLETLAQVYVDQKKYSDASLVYREIVDSAGLPASQKQDAELSIVHIKILSNNQSGAKADLEKLAAAAGDKGPFAARVKVMQAEILASEKKLDEALKLARGIIRETSDKSVKAVAHNTIGYCLFEGGNLKDARWEFLWVDVVYNSDKSEHAKALYYLGKIFTQLGDGQRAQECFQALINDRAFGGMNWQVLAQKELKAAQQ